MDRITCDICIIGAGSGGLSVAAGAAQMGADTVLVEGHRMGGDCLNYGCVPSKSLIASAETAHRMAFPGDLGISPTAPGIDYAAAKDHVQRVIETIAPVDSQERFEGFGVRVIRDWARFTSPTTLVAGEHEITARRFVIATGSRPVVPPIDGIADVPYLTNETLFDLRERPDHLLVIGGGPIGLEMAQAHRRLGSEVTVIESGRAMAREDPQMADIVLARLRAEGITIAGGHRATRVARDGERIVLETDHGRFEGTHLLVAVGRSATLDRLDLDTAEVAHDGSVTVGDDLRSTTNRRVYAIGDAAGQGQFTHLAGYHGGIVVRSAILGVPAKAKMDHIPRATYTDPELAHVGLTEKDAVARHGRGAIQTFEAEFDENDRAQATGQTLGRVKIVVRRGKPVGATIVHHHAGELIAPWSMAIANGLKLTAFTNTVLPYPTLSETSKKAASAYYSPKLFDNPWVKRAVRLVQKVVR